METVTPDRSLRWYAAREPIILGVLTLISFAGFVGVGALTNLYHRDQQFRGTRWNKRGRADMNAKDFPRAVTDFRTALLFSRDNSAYELGLAEALNAQGGTGTDRAYVYLMDLRERQPENGTVNLDLARILAARREKNEALRYYHNAIYALWSQNPEGQRRAAQLELAEFLLGQNATTQAQAELIALSGDLPPEVGLHLHVGDLFMQAQDYDHAAGQYRHDLGIEHQNTASMAGIGKAAFQTGDYSLSQRYLQDAVAAGADGDSERSLKTVNLVLSMDPFRRQVPGVAAPAHGDRSVRNGRSAAGWLSGRGATRGDARCFRGARADIAGRFCNASGAMVCHEAPNHGSSRLRRDPDQIEAAMELVFAIEREAKARCGTPNGRDLALLLISRLHEGN